MNTQVLYRTLTVFAPIVAVVCAASVSGWEVRRLQQLQAQTVVTETKLAQIEKELREFRLQPVLDKQPTEPKTPREQAVFLDMLRSNADASHVQLVRWSNTTPPPVPPPASGGGDNAPKGLPAGVSPVLSTIEVVGTFNNTRQFLYRLTQCHRLMNMNDLKIVRELWPNTHLTFTLTRYVGPAIQSPLDAQAAAAPHDENGHADRIADHADHRPGAAFMPAGPSSEGPINVPVFSRNNYQTKLDANVQQLTDAAHTDASSHTGAAPAQKR